MGMIGKNRRMAVLFLLAFRFVRLLLSGHQGVALENAALRMQIAAFQRKRKRPLLTTVDRVFWITLRSLWDNWRKPLLYVQPDRLCDGSASGSGNSGLGFASRSTGAEVAPARAQNSVD